LLGDGCFFVIYSKTQHCHTETIPCMTVDSTLPRRARARRPRRRPTRRTPGCGPGVLPTSWSIRQPETPTLTITSSTPLPLSGRGDDSLPGRRPGSSDRR
jgi:hypothetical protein